MFKKKFEKGRKKIAMGNSLCSKKFLCEFCDFLKQNLQFFVATLWQHCTTRDGSSLDWYSEDSYSSQGVPQKVHWKECTPKGNFEHMIWHLRRFWSEGYLEGGWKDGHCPPVIK